MKKLFLVLFVAILNFAPLLAQDNPATGPSRYNPGTDWKTAVSDQNRRRHRRRHRHRHRHRRHRVTSTIAPSAFLSARGARDL